MVMALGVERGAGQTGAEFSEETLCLDLLPALPEVLLLPVCSKSHLLGAQSLMPAVQWTQGEGKDCWIYCPVVLDYAYAAVSPLNITALCRAAGFYGF